jgi:hypothetical protein
MNEVDTCIRSLEIGNRSRRAPDGRFVIHRSGQTEAGGDTPSNMIVVQNWTEELKRLVPTH